jgi:PAS domain-containing protein
MRALIVACVALAGCMSPEQRAQWQAQRQSEARYQALYASSPMGIADAGCRTKTQFAMAGHRPSSILDLEGTAKANQMHASCMEYWRRTGQFP